MSKRAPPDLEDDVISVESLSDLDQLLVPDDEPSGAGALKTLCPARHDVQRFVVPWSGDFTCDRCLKASAAGCIMWSCRCCGYDLCDACSYAGPPYGSCLQQTPTKARLASPRPLWASKCYAYRFDVSPSRRDCKAELAPSQLRALVQAVREELAAGEAPARPAPEEAGPGPGAVSQEWALRTVDATTAELSRLMARVQAAPRQEKAALLAQAALVEASGEYALALAHLQREPPERAAIGTDPLGGTVVYASC
mmetsp:Transcript_16903/g.48257  ORF Transcript_16903/g.48257 Transcript_16903/m.48257 type:complete len:253 (-) Transcript_16903:164-922(-)